MNFENAPFDTQRCILKLGLFSTPEHEVSLHWKPEVEPVANAISKDNCLSKWVVTDVESRNVSMVYKVGTWTMVETSVFFTRLPSLLIGVYVIPAFIFVFLSYLGFYIDPASTPARVTLGMITILAVITNRSKLSVDLPSAANSWISNFLLMSLGFNIFSFTEQVAVNLGMTTHRWLMTERERSVKARKTAQAKLAGKYTDVELLIKGLVTCREEVLQLFEEVDIE